MAASKMPLVLVSWHTDPRYIPPFVLSDRQIAIGPKVNPDQPRLLAGWSPKGAYDLEVVLKQQRLPIRYDLLVVSSDSSGINHPLNLDFAGCPKVLFLGDTHHLARPVRRLLHYARHAGFDYIAVGYNRQHMHWFTEAGFRVAWFPGLPVDHIPRPLRFPRHQRVCFFGQSGRFHLRRRRLLDAIESAGVPLQRTQGPRAQGADLYASSTVSFNASLNGDLNLRNFEILSAGGCLLTDRLGSESGLELLLQEDRDFFAYGTQEELVDIARYLLERPDAAITVARAGHEKFVDSMLPQRRASQLLSWVLEGRIDSMFAPRPRSQGNGAISLVERADIYDRVQELHRTIESPRVLIAPDVPEIIAADIRDLARLRITIGRPHEHHGQTWDCVVRNGASGVGCLPGDSCGCSPMPDIKGQG
jgi:hypothetical protein